MFRVLLLKQKRSKTSRVNGPREIEFGKVQFREDEMHEIQQTSHMGYWFATIVLKTT